MPTLPGPISQTPLLQTKFVVISVGATSPGGGDGAGVGDGDGLGFACATTGAAVATAAGRVAPRIAAASDPVISSALSGERMTTSLAAGSGRSGAGRMR
jgi:hypothetical protein